MEYNTKLDILNPVPDSSRGSRWQGGQAKNPRVFRLPTDNRPAYPDCHAPAHHVPKHNAGRTGSSMTLPATTDLSLLSGRVLAVMDEDNLRISMLKSHDRKLSYRWLFQRLAQSASYLSAWAILTSPAHDKRRAAYLGKHGWRVFDITQELVGTVRGVEKKANADFELAFAAGHLITSYPFDSVVIGTGDGDLGMGVVRGMNQFGFYPSVYVLGVPGASSGRLRHADKKLVTGFIPIGIDLTRPANGCPGDRDRLYSH